ncbi:EF-P beta-lysylation protein EpmB [Salicola sp. Rm-C-2C1-2]|uniref:EF-P beta-lysylation protein EpmB n=1 Tax=Salicola sp. Rm-C-2C1-2 TaxID=3141321 RepID=UPI0032E4BD97
MIQSGHARVETTTIASDRPRWQKELGRAITTPEALCQRLSLPESMIAGMAAGHRQFPIRAPEPWLQRIEPGNPDDPLLRQILPFPEEGEDHTGYVSDPLEEVSGDDASAASGLVHKYASRALLMVTGACAINCRYCFRRHFPYDEHQLGGSGWDEALARIQADPAINEVIFSGGDPLASPDRLLARLAAAVAAIPTVQRLRIHTRLPVVIPQRVNADLLEWLSQTPLQKVLVLHINHPAEIDDDVRRALRALADTGATLLNQAVLLRRINDNAETLERLSERLFECGVLPYYLHAFDPIAGAAHYDTGDEKARELARQLIERLPGFLVPRLVREIPGAPAKQPLNL